MVKFVGFLMFLSLWSFPQSTMGTVIVAIRTPEELIVGADSKRQREKNGTMFSERVCKIRRVDDSLFFAKAGYESFGLVGRIVVEDTLKEVHKKGQTISQTMKGFETVMKGRLLTTVGRMKQDHYNVYQRNLSKYLIQLLLFGIENSTPVWHYLNLQAFDSPLEGLRIVPDRRICPGNCIDGEPVSIGEAGEIGKFRMEHPKFSQQQSKPEVIRHLMQIAFKAHPESVEPPIDIFQLTKKETEWVQVKEGCRFK